ncbi:ECU07_1655 [Encephalitozoon cuniculi GB-M1]|uniref:ECU07_1655 protein n=1 Tax=Encephalitozoon cuniculi (strain GB-M1) TaxID=284813 RepID=I7KFX8_ENCCU|nr:uncharacterized protein ECU07_1655 [Encephalitozoon cuniculi GB-M1]CCI73958.1 ECU07_1655 [Encephalitozoon cuniculi GB-M1]
MEKRNRELAKENAELKRRIGTMRRTEGELLKDSIKKGYLGSRMCKRISVELEKNITTIEGVLGNLKELREDIIEGGYRETLGDKLNLQG